MESCGEARPTLSLARAIKEYKLLLDLDYPRQIALETVSRRHLLTGVEKQLVYRTIHPSSHDSRVYEKTVWRLAGSNCIAIDYYNVATVIAEALEGHCVYRGSDGFTRDLAKAYGRSRKKPVIHYKIVELLAYYLSKTYIGRVFFVADKQVSHSGEVMARIRSAYPGATTILSEKADKALLSLSEKGCIVASGDTVVLEKAGILHDLSYSILEEQGLVGSVFEVWRIPLMLGYKG